MKNWFKVFWKSFIRTFRDPERLGEILVKSFILIMIYYFLRWIAVYMDYIIK